MAAPFGPVCSDADCSCHHGLAGLDSLCPVEFVTVANDPDLTLAELTAACAAFLSSAGWGGEGGQLAAYMAGSATEIAKRFPIGARLRASFDHGVDDWTFTQCDLVR